MCHRRAPGNEEIIYLYIYKLYFLMKGAYCFAAIYRDTDLPLTKQHQTQFLRLCESIAKFVHFRIYFFYDYLASSTTSDNRS